MVPSIPISLRADARAASGQRLCRHRLVQEQVDDAAQLALPRIGRGPCGITRRRADPRLGPAADPLDRLRSRPRARWWCSRILAPSRPTQQPEVAPVAAGGPSAGEAPTRTSPCLAAFQQGGVRPHDGRDHQMGRAGAGLRLLPPGGRGLCRRQSAQADRAAHAGDDAHDQRELDQPRRCAGRDLLSRATRARICPTAAGSSMRRSKPPEGGIVGKPQAWNTQAKTIRTFFPTRPNRMFLLQGLPAGKLQNGATARHRRPSPASSTTANTPNRSISS